MSDAADRDWQLERKKARAWLANSNGGSRPLFVGSHEISPPAKGELSPHVLDDLASEAVTQAFAKETDALYQAAIAYQAHWRAITGQPEIEPDLEESIEEESPRSGAALLNEDALYHSEAEFTPALDLVCRGRFLKYHGRNWDTVPEWVRLRLRVAYLEHSPSYSIETRARDALTNLKSAALEVRALSETDKEVGGVRAKFARQLASKMIGEPWDTLLEWSPDDALDVDQRGIGLSNSRQRLAYAWPRIRRRMQRPPAEPFNSFDNLELLELLEGPIFGARSLDDSAIDTPPTELAVVWLLCGGKPKYGKVDWAGGLSPRKAIESVKGGFTSTSGTGGAIAAARKVQLAAGRALAASQHTGGSDESGEKKE